MEASLVTGTMEGAQNANSGADWNTVLFDLRRSVSNLVLYVLESMPVPWLVHPPQVAAPVPTSSEEWLLSPLSTVPLQPPSHGHVNPAHAPEIKKETATKPVAASSTASPATPAKRSVAKKRAASTHASTSLAQPLGPPTQQPMPMQQSLPSSSTGPGPSSFDALMHHAFL